MTNSKQPRAYIGHALSILTVIIYGYNVSIIGFVLPHEIGPFGLVLLRTLCTFGVFWLISLFTKERKVKLSNSDNRKIALLGIMGFSAQLLLYYAGMSRTEPIDIAVIRSFIPFMILLIGLIMHTQKRSWQKIAGLILGLIGVVFASLTPYNASVTNSTFMGGVMIFISTLIVAIYTIGIAPLSTKVPAITLMKRLSVWGVIFSIPFGAKELIEAPLLKSLPSWETLWYLIVTCVVVGVGANILNIVALRYISPLVRGSYFYFMPIVGTLIAMILKVQYPTWHDPVAFALIIAGFILIGRTTKTR